MCSVQYIQFEEVRISHALGRNIFAASCKCVSVCVCWEQCGDPAAVSRRRRRLQKQKTTHTRVTCECVFLCTRARDSSPSGFQSQVQALPLTYPSFNIHSLYILANIPNILRCVVVVAEWQRHTKNTLFICFSDVCVSVSVCVSVRSRIVNNSNLRSSNFYIEQHIT